MLLSPDELERLREQPLRHCHECRVGEIALDYCREHDEFFEYGHRIDCSRHSVHEMHRNYRHFNGTSESTLDELMNEYDTERYYY